MKDYGNAKVRDNAKVFGKAKVYDNAIIYGHARVYGVAAVYGDAVVYGNAEVYNGAKVGGLARVYDNAKVFSYAKVYGNAEVFGNAEVCGHAIITSDKDYIVFKNWWSSGRYFTWTKGNDMWKVGCFYGTGKELIEKAYKDSKSSGKEYKKVVDYVNSIKTNKYDRIRKNIKERFLSKMRKLLGK